MASSRKHLHPGGSKEGRCNVTTQQQNGLTVSVIVPVFDGERFIAEALSSILAQTRPADEIIVVDDGSTDGSAAIAGSMADVQVVRKEHSGLGATLNAGVRAASGNVLAFLDADDRWLPEKLARQVSALEANAELDIVFGHCRQFAVRFENGHMRETMGARQSGIAKSAMVIRAESLRRVGLFSESQEVHDFLDWYTRAQELGLRADVLDDVVYERRIHEYNFGRRYTAQQKATYLTTLRTHVKRIRD